MFNIQNPKYNCDKENIQKLININDKQNPEFENIINYILNN